MASCAYLGLVTSSFLIPKSLNLSLHLKAMASYSQRCLLLLTPIIVSFATPCDAITYSEATYNAVLLAHGTIYCVAFALIFPLGALLLRFFPSNSRDLLWYHAALQILGIIFMFVGFGLGAWLCSTFPPCGLANDVPVKKLWLSIHEGLGYLFLLFVLLQLGLGYWRHYHYRVHRKRDWKAIVHVWFGRVLMLLGLAMTTFSFSPGSARVAYGAISIVLFLFYAAVVSRAIWEERKRGSVSTDVRS